MPQTLSLIHICSVDGNGGPDERMKEGWDLLRWLNDEINARQPWKITIAEDLRSDASMTRPTHAGGAGFASQWDAGFVHPIRSALIAQNDDNRYMNAIIGALTARYNDSAFQRVIYTESHDEVANGKDVYKRQALNLYLCDPRPD